jgi:hypothetical protein
LIYTLDRFDFLAVWAEETRPAQPPPKRRFLSGGALPIIIVVLPIIGLVMVGDLLADDTLHHRPTAGLVPLPLFVVWLLALAYYLGSRGSTPAPVVADDLNARADALERIGAIDPHRIHWLLLTAEGFTEVTELRRRHRGVEYYQHGETSVPWAEVSCVETLPRHMVLRARNGQTWIIPTRCLRDEQEAGWFVQTVRAYQQAAAKAVTALPVLQEGIREARETAGR